ncbi:MAG: fibronectin type III domain-containing protein, partial [Pontimonas sp.]|nr:fibronectin type III domain-containing protein [Pontimonas sp.]
MPLIERTSDITGTSVVYAKPGTYLPWSDAGNTDAPITPGSGGAANYTYGASDLPGGGQGAAGVVILSYSLAPDTPTSLIATQSTSHATVNLSWTAPSYTGNSSITDYDIEYKPAGGSWTSYSDGVSTATTAAVQLPQQCIAHEFRVIAKNTNFSSVASATASATPVWGTFGSLTGVQISSTNSECVVRFTSITGTTWTPPSGTTTVEALLVGGGGGGGAWVGGGGGGGGVTQSIVALTPNIAVSVDVGAGGSGASKIGGGAVNVAGIGEPSTFSSLTAFGGGAGMSWAATELT